MREGTSGLIFTQSRDGSIQVMVIDYGVEEFGGRDLECCVDIDGPNAKKLVEELSKLQSGTLEEMLQSQFSCGDDFDIYKLTSFCNAKGIEFTQSSW